MKEIFCVYPRESPLYNQTVHNQVVHNQVVHNQTVKAQTSLPPHFS